MTPRPSSARSGITLTEILISILIMGVGLISLATLFPLGLVRLREAARQSRSGLLAETAIGDVGAKNLFNKQSFSESYYGFYDPWLQDYDPTGKITLVAYTPGVILPAAPPVPMASSIGRSPGGLPVCYDPLWRAVTDVPPFTANAVLTSIFPAGSFAEARFGAGIIGADSNLRPDPTGGNASAYGLQRITNFVPFVTGAPATYTWPFTYIRPGSAHPATIRDLVAETFVSLDDVVMQNSESNQQILNNPNTSGIAGSVVPDFFPTSGTTSEIRNDWKYTWFFTGRQVDTTVGTVFEGDVVVCDGRPFGFDTVLYPVTGGTPKVAAGETTIEAIFGYSAQVQFPDSNGRGYGAAADRTVLLRWPAAMADPEIKIGGWFADVTYERYQTTSDGRSVLYGGVGPTYPMQRCHWYQVAKKGDVETEVINNVAYRRMLVSTNTTLKSRTLLTAGGNPVYLNAALIMPSVINVFSKTFSH